MKDLIENFSNSRDKIGYFEDCREGYPLSHQTDQRKTRAPHIPTGHGCEVSQWLLMNWSSILALTMVYSHIFGSVCFGHLYLWILGF